MKIDYLEFSIENLGPSRAFFAKAFGWEFTEYGPEYLAFNNAGIEGGLGKPDEEVRPPLVILKSDDLEAAQKQVEDAGGKIVRDIFSFPGGRRFHFIEPGGNEMAVWSEN